MTAKPDNLSDEEWDSMPEKVRVMMAQMRVHAERAGVQLPDIDAKGNVRVPPPSVSLQGRPSVVTRRIAEIAAGAGLYRMNRDLVSICPTTGEVEVMTPEIFREWIDNHCVVYKKTTG